MIKKTTIPSFLTILFASLALVFAGCENNGVEDAADETGDAIEEAGEEIQDAID